MHANENTDLLLCMMSQKVKEKGYILQLSPYHVLACFLPLRKFAVASSFWGWHLKAAMLQCHEKLSVYRMKEENSSVKYGVEDMVECTRGG